MQTFVLTFYDYSSIADHSYLRKPDRVKVALSSIMKSIDLYRGKNPPLHMR